MNDFTTARVAMFALQDAVLNLQWEIDENGNLIAKIPLTAEAVDLFTQARAMFTPR